MNYETNLAILTANVRAAVAAAKRDGITSIARANLRQVVSTRGLTIEPAAFDRLLSDAITAANVGRFIR